MEPENMEELQPLEASTSEASSELHDEEPLKKELERVREKKEGRTKLEKLIYTQRKIEQQIREEKEAAGLIEEPIEEESEIPEWFRKHQQETATKTANQLVDEIQNETERELTRYHLQNSIRSTGVPQDDLRLARAIVSSIKNEQIVQEIQRKPQANSHSGYTSAPAKVEMNDTLTPDEIAVMRQFKLTKEEVLDARRKESERVARSIPTARF